MRKTDADDTDAKLNVERERSNDELLERSTALGEDAEAVIVQARARAAAVLELARRREDAALDPSVEILDERARADVALELEYRLADETLDDERSRRLRALVQLLATERNATDRALAVERSGTAHTLAARDDLLAGVQHDTRGVLSILMLNASLIAARSRDRETVAMANTMLRAAAQIDSLFVDMLDATTMQSGALVLQAERTDMVSLVGDVVELNRLAAEAHSIELAYEAHPTSLEARVDARRLVRVLMNLLGNALKFVPDGGQIGGSVKPVDRDVVVEIADTGPGIPPDQLDVIFERYRRTEGATRKAGYGLGLYIAHGIVAAHGGRIWATNNARGGATFSFTLPLDQPTS